VASETKAEEFFDIDWALKKICEYWGCKKLSGRRNAEGSEVCSRDEEIFSSSSSSHWQLLLRAGV
jgi:hypothetical protein